MMRFFILFFPAKCGQECGQITGIFILLKHDFNGGKRKSVYGKTEQEAKRKRREWKKNVNSSAVLGNDRITVGQPMKRYQKILVRRNRTRAQGKAGPGARQNRAGYKANRARVQGKQNPGTRRNRTQVQGETGPGTRRNRAGRKAKQGRAQGKAGPGARRNRAGCRHRDYRQRSPSTESG